jgi:hypothetical protein
MLTKQTCKGTILILRFALSQALSIKDFPQFQEKIDLIGTLTLKEQNFVTLKKKNVKNRIFTLE